MTCAILICYGLVLFGLFNSISSTVIAVNKHNFTEEFRDKEAWFGTAIGPDGIKGLLVKADPIDACKPIKGLPSSGNQTDSSNSSLNIFVIVQRGQCNFANKVLNAQKAKYDAVIVYNVGSDMLLTMTADHEAIVIPSVFVGETAGYILRSFYLRDAESSSHIEIFSDRNLALDDILIPFCGVLGSACFCMLAYITFRYFRIRVQVTRSRLSRERLKQLPTKKYTKGDECDLCAICLDDYEEGDCLRVLPCKHAYHCKCIDPWLTEAKRVCPLCKRRVLSEDNSNDGDYPERSRLLDDATAASPNASRYATGFTSMNPFRRYSNSESSFSEADSLSPETEDETLNAFAEHVVADAPAPDPTGFSIASSFEANISPSSLVDDGDERLPPYELTPPEETTGRMKTKQPSITSCGSRAENDTLEPSAAEAEVVVCQAATVTKQNPQEPIVS